MPSKTSKNTQRNKQYEALGKAVAEFYESGYVNRRSMLKMSFLKGVLAGLGGVIGATVVVALLLWGLSLFGNVPFVGRFVDNLERTIETQN